ncbi:hypothetical protein [Neolewinella persica]|uniref:hypothetical protein n=1 Tax=Neolewinella persica TaxID=70998 RepID=UPI00035DD152|nr:hypothetical protein [Neolewinella persica]
MKDVVKSPFYIFIVIIFLFGTLHQASAQKDFNITTGVGIPELLNVGVRYQINQFQIGSSIGSFPAIDESSISISSDVYYHFGRPSKLSTRRPWYGKIGLNYLRDEDEYKINKYLHFNTRIGREINISDKTGFQIEFGILHEMSSKSIIKKPLPSCTWCFNFDLSWPIIPSIGIGFFFKT